MITSVQNNLHVLNLKSTTVSWFEQICTALTMFVENSSLRKQTIHNVWGNCPLKNWIIVLKKLTKFPKKTASKSLMQPWSLKFYWKSSFTGVFHKNLGDFLRQTHFRSPLDDCFKNAISVTSSCLYFGVNIQLKICRTNYHGSQF